MEGQVGQKTVLMMINTALTRQEAENHQNNLENVVTKSNKIITGMHSSLSKTLVEVENQEENKTQHTRDQQKRENSKAPNTMQSTEGTAVNVDTLYDDGEHNKSPQEDSTVFESKTMTQRLAESGANRQVEENLVLKQTKKLLLLV